MSQNTTVVSRIPKQLTSWPRSVIIWGLIGFIIFFAVQLAISVWRLYANPVASQSINMNSDFVAALSGGGEWMLDDGEFMFGFGHRALIMPAATIDGQSLQIHTGETSPTIAKTQRSSNDSVPKFASALFAVSRRMASRVSKGETTGWAYVTSLSEAEIFKSIDQAGTSPEQLQSDGRCAVFVVQTVDSRWFLLLEQSDNPQQLLMVLRAPEAQFAH